MCSWGKYGQKLQKDQKKQNKTKKKPQNKTNPQLPLLKSWEEKQGVRSQKQTTTHAPALNSTKGELGGT